MTERTDVQKLAEAIDDALNHHASDKNDPMRIPKWRSEQIAQLVSDIGYNCVSEGELSRELRANIDARLSDQEVIEETLVIGQRVKSNTQLIEDAKKLFHEDRDSKAGQIAYVLAARLSKRSRESEIVAAIGASLDRSEKLLHETGDRGHEYVDAHWLRALVTGQEPPGTAEAAPKRDTSDGTVSCGTCNGPKARAAYHTLGDCVTHLKERVEGLRAEVGGYQDAMDNIDRMLRGSGIGPERFDRYVQQRRPVPRPGARSPRVDEKLFSPIMSRPSAARMTP